MLTVKGFRRARAPEQIEARRDDLLRSASELLREGGLDAVSLTAIAKRAGLAKSNVYRYFESREEILQELLVTDELRWVGEVERGLAPLAGSDRPDAVAQVLVEALLAYPTMCQLISVVANVLEHNLSVESVARFKARVLEMSLRLGNALHAALPSLPHARTEALLRYVHALIGGLWPLAHPAPQAREVMAQPAYSALCSDFGEDMRGALEALLVGVLASGRHEVRVSSRGGP